MILTLDQAKRFSHMFSAVMRYAETQFTDVSLLVEPDGSVNHEIELELVEALAENPEFVDGFIEKNPAGLPAADLEALRAWKHALSGMFVVFEGDLGEALFMGDGHIFEVAGITEEIIPMLASVPAVVHATLLPFEESITYARLLNQMQIDIGPGMMTMFDDEFSRILEKDGIVDMASQFIKLQPSIVRSRDERLHEQAEREDKLEQDLCEQVPGSHRGVLAGLSEEERIALIDKDDMADGIFLKHMRRAIEDNAIPAGPDISTMDLLEATPKERLMDTLRDLDEYLDEHPDEYPDEESDVRSLAKSLFAAMQDSDTLREIALCSNECGMEALQDLLAHPVKYRCKSLSDFCEGEYKGHVYPLLFLDAFVAVIEEDGLYSFVIPDDLRLLLDDLDFDEIVERVGQLEAFYAKLRTLVELRGVVPRAQAVNEFSPGMDAEEFEDTLAEVIRTNRVFDAEIAMVGMGDTEYFVNDMLAEQLDYDFDLVRRFFERANAKVGPATLTQAMVDAGDMATYKFALPEVRALRNFLDEHVPDDENDLYYADRFVEDLVFGVEESGDPRFFSEFLQERNLVMNEGQLNQLLGLMMNAVNALPTWENAGWSPNALLSVEMSLADIGKRKIGRNDPCPCGSGKKYKKCCGR